MTYFQKCQLYTIACLDTHSTAGSLDASVTPPSSVHSAAVAFLTSCAAVASPASCSASASPVPCADIDPDLYDSVGWSLDDCFLQRSCLSGLVAFPTSTHSPRYSLGTYQSFIPAVCPPDILTSLSYEPTAALKLDATLSARSHMTAVAVLPRGVHLTAFMHGPA